MSTATAVSALRPCPLGRPRRDPKTLRPGQVWAFRDGPTSPWVMCDQRRPRIVERLREQGWDVAAIDVSRVLLAPPLSAYWLVGHHQLLHCLDLLAHAGDLMAAVLERHPDEAARSSNRALLRAIDQAIAFNQEGLR